MIAHTLKDKHKVAGDIHSLNLLVVLVRSNANMITHHRGNSNSLSSYNESTGYVLL